MSATAAPAAGNAARIDGDVSPPNNVAADGDVHVTGGVRPGGRVSGGEVVIDGDVEAASINARAGLRIGGGLTAGRCTAAGDVECRSARGLTIVAGGDIVTGGDLTKVRTCCGGAVRAGGAIVDSQISANGGIFCRVAGDGTTATTLVAGVDLHVRVANAMRQSEAERLTQQAREMRGQAEPLMQRMRQLSAAEKEQVTVMLYEVGEFESACNRLLGAQQEAVAASQRATKAIIEVAEEIRPNVTLRLGNRIATTTQAYPGPFRVEASLRDGKPVLVLKAMGAGESPVLDADVVEEPAS